MHFFNLVDHIEILGDAILAFFLGVGDHLRIHLGELVGFAFDGGLEVGGGVADLSLRRWAWAWMVSASAAARNSLAT